MVGIALVPEWFVPYAAASESLFLITALLVAFFSFRVFRLSANRLALSFGIGFSVLALSHLLRTVFELLSLISVIQCGSSVFSHCSLLVITSRTHMFAALIAFALIAYVTLRPARVEPAVLLVALSVLPLFIAGDALFAYGLVSSILLAYLAGYFGLNALHKRNMLSVFVAAGFAFLFASSIFTVLSVSWSIFGFVGTLAKLAGYACILANYVGVIRR